MGLMKHFVSEGQRSPPLFRWRLPSFPLFTDLSSEKEPRSIASLPLFQGILRKWTETWTPSVYTKHRRGFEQFSLVTSVSHEIVGMFQRGDLRRLLITHHLPQPSFLFLFSPFWPFSSSGCPSNPSCCCSVSTEIGRQKPESD